MYVEAVRYLHNISARIHPNQGDQQYSWLINKHCREIQFPLKLSHGSGFLITSTTAPCSSSFFVPPTDFPIQWSSFHTTCGPELGRSVWEKRGGVLASERQRHSQREGKGEQGEVVTQRGKLSFLEMGQHKSRAFTLCAASFAAELVLRSKYMGL